MANRDSGGGVGKAFGGIEGELSTCDGFAWPLGENGGVGDRRAES
jgi:hypothetical protein